MDNSPEYVSHTLVSWAEKQGMTCKQLQQRVCYDTPVMQDDPVLEGS
jgi:hypothetical protein